MTEQLGIPVWGSYVIFGLVTLFSGLALGLVSNYAAFHKFLNQLNSIESSHSELTEQALTVK